MTSGVLAARLYAKVHVNVCCAAMHAHRSRLLHLESVRELVYVGKAS